jgi:hypothetical protein
MITLVHLSVFFGKFLPFGKKKIHKKNFGQKNNFFENDQPFTWKMFVLPQRKASPSANVLSLEILAFP